MAGHRFKEFLSATYQGPGKDDFADEALKDDTLPDPSSWDELQEYLQRCGVNNDGLNAAKCVWSHYARRYGLQEE